MVVNGADEILWPHNEPAPWAGKILISLGKSSNLLKSESYEAAASLAGYLDSEKPVPAA